MGTTNRATVAMVTDDPEHKSAMREGLAGAFGDQGSAQSAANGFASAAAGGGGAAAGLDTATQQKLQQLAQSDPAAYEKEMKKLGAAALANVDPATQERLAKLKENDPVAYEKELSKLGAAVAAGVAAGVAGAGGAGAAGGGGAGGAGGAAGAGGAGGVVAGAGIAGAAAVAGVDKATKDKLEKMKQSDPAAYEAELKKIGEKAVANMDKATQERLAKLKASDPAAYEKELKKLGSVAAAGGQPAGGRVGQQVASNGLSNGAGGVGAGGGVVTSEQEELVAKMLASGMDEATAYQYLQQLCGVAGKGITPEAKALMEQILASNGSKEEIASRVEALLAGSELSSSRGVNGGFDGTNLSEARSGKIPQLDEDSLAVPGQQGSLADRIRARNAAKGARGSVKRQS